MEALLIILMDKGNQKIGWSLSTVRGAAKSKILCCSKMATSCFMSHLEKLCTGKNCWFGMETAITCLWEFQLESRLRCRKKKIAKPDKVSFYTVEFTAIRDNNKTTTNSAWINSWQWYTFLMTNKQLIVGSHGLIFSLLKPIYSKNLILLNFICNIIQIFILSWNHCRWVWQFLVWKVW